MATSTIPGLTQWLGKNSLGKAGYGLWVDIMVLGSVVLQWFLDFVGRRNTSILQNDAKCIFKNLRHLKFKFTMFTMQSLARYWYWLPLENPRLQLCLSIGWKTYGADEASGSWFFVKTGYAWIDPFLRISKSNVLKLSLGDDHSRAFVSTTSCLFCIDGCFFGVARGTLDVNALGDSHSAVGVYYIHLGAHIPDVSHGC